MTRKDSYYCWMVIWLLFCAHLLMSSLFNQFNGQPFLWISNLFTILSTLFKDNIIVWSSTGEKIIFKLNDDSPNHHWFSIDIHVKFKLRKKPLRYFDDDLTSLVCIVCLSSCNLAKLDNHFTIHKVEMEKNVEPYNKWTSELFFFYYY